MGIIVACYNVFTVSLEAQFISLVEEAGLGWNDWFLALVSVSVFSISALQLADSSMVINIATVLLAIYKHTHIYTHTYRE